MTRLRRSLVLVSVVLFALALGIALGGGALQGPVRGVLQSQVQAVTDGGPTDASLQRENRSLNRSVRFDSGFAQAVSPDLLSGRLTGHSVAVLALPGVPSSVTDAVATDVGTAGGSVTTKLRVGHDLVDPTARPLVDELSQRLMGDVDDVDVPDGSTVYSRVGAVAARALLTSTEGGEAMDESARSVFSTFSTAGLLEGTEPQERADTAIVLVPEAPGRASTSAGRSTVLTDLVAAMDHASDGVVVSGPASAADDGELIAGVRKSALTAESVSTVDSAGLRAGQVVTVLALAEQAEGTTGHYGVAPGADAVLPAGSAAE